MRRRATVAVGAAAVLGIGAGLGTAWRRRGDGDAADAGPAGTADLWSARPVRPDGTPLDLAVFRGRPLLANFWATWCVPCVTELPLLDRFHARQSVGNGWQVVALALDSASNVRRFLEATPVRMPLAVLDAAAYDLHRRLGNTQGGLPFTVVHDAQGRVALRHLGAVDQGMLDSWVAALN